MRDKRVYYYCEEFSLSKLLRNTIIPYSILARFVTYGAMKLHHPIATDIAINSFLSRSSIRYTIIPLSTDERVESKGNMSPNLMILLMFASTLRFSPHLKPMINSKASREC